MRTGVQFSQDDTLGCTKEACSFRDANHLMQKRGVVVLGASTDSVDSHEKFADKYGLPFPLLSDTDTHVSHSLLKNFIVELTYRVHGQVLISKGIFVRNPFLYPS